MITCRFENGHETNDLRHAVVHAIVEKDGALLLGKRAEFLLEGGKWGLPGGYVDRDETVEQAVLRELKEETGWEGEIISFFRVNSNPNRDKEDRQNIVFEFLVKPIVQSGTPDKETTAIEWILFDKIWSSQEIAFDHGKTIELYLKYKKKPFPLPVME